MGFEWWLDVFHISEQLRRSYTDLIDWQFQYEWLCTMRPRQYGRHLADDIFKVIFLHENSCIWFKFHRIIPKPDVQITSCYCPACRTYEIATRFWVVVICPIIKCLTVLEFSFILFDLCWFITIFNFILNYVLIVTIWIFTYHKIWILLIIYCFIWNYWIIYFWTCLEVFWSVVS